MRLIPLLQKHNTQTKHTANLSGFFSSPQCKRLLSSMYIAKLRFSSPICVKEKKKQMSSVVLLLNIIR